jgi:nitrogen fixation NifU-like protein
MVKGKQPDEVGNYTQQDVLDSLGGLPDENKHCALLAINTLKEAINNYYKNLKK